MVNSSLIIKVILPKNYLFVVSPSLIGLVGEGSDVSLNVRLINLKIQLKHKKKSKQTNIQLLSSIKTSWYGNGIGFCCRINLLSAAV